MERFNNGLVFTNNNCIGCNKCISSCSILGANVSVFSGNDLAGIKEGKYVIKVNELKCSNCGKCLDVCPHHARNYNDDIDEFLNQLKQNNKISLIVNINFLQMYGDLAVQVLGYLHSMGVEKIYTTEVGKEIAIWQNVNYVKDAKENKDFYHRGFIVNNCSGILNHMELFYPNLKHQIIPVQSDLLCTAIYARKYLKDENTFAYLGPCTAVKDECQHNDENNLIKYFILYSKLISRIESKLDSSVTYIPEDKSLGLKNLVPVIDSSAVTYSYFFAPWENIREFKVLNNEIMNEVLECNNIENQEMRPVIATFTSCNSGCRNGPGIYKKNFSINKIDSYYLKEKKDALLKYTNHSDYEDNYNRMNDLFRDLDGNDFKLTFVDRYIQQSRVPEYAYKEIYHTMLKDTEEKRNINCGSCGYDTCHQMARAIAYGYNKKENCIHYMNDKMEQYSSTDSLTGVFNLNAFIKKTTKLLNDNPDIQYFICSGDINKFKIFNEINGSKLGDVVLIEIAKELQQIIGQNGILCRNNGGNFNFCFEASAENLQRLREKKVFEIKGIDFPVTMRFGIYITNSRPINIQQILNWTALARDENKEAETYKNVFKLFNNDLKERMETEGRVTSEMKVALEKQEFQLYYQPQYEAATGHLHGAEALCRWIKSNGEMVMPGLFIPIAEKNGYIKDLDHIIWEKAFKNLRNWLDQGLDVVPISLNVSRISLYDDAFNSKIHRLFTEYKIPSDLIHFELTESAVMTQHKEFIDRIKTIKKENKLIIAMDDFGTGYSSLNSLKDLPIDILKLDMGFLRDSMNSSVDIGGKGGSIISSMIHMAQNINVTTIAEGVEDESQANYLKSLGCDIIQGYYYARPMNEDKFLELLTNSKIAEKKTNKSNTNFFGMDKLSDPNSSESRFFEHFAGAATIIKYYEKQNHIEIERCNERLLKLLGLSSNSVSNINNILSDYLKNEENAPIFSAIKESIVIGKEVEFQSLYKNFETGLPMWLYVYLQPVSHNGDLYTFYMRLTDITKEKYAEKMIKATNSQYSLMMEKSQVGMCLSYVKFDPRNIKQTLKIRYLNVNHQFEVISGFPREEVLNWTEKDALKVVYPLDLPKFMAYTIKAIYKNCEEPFTYTYRAKQKDGAIVKVQTTMSGEKQKDNSYLIVSNYIVLSE